MNRKLGLAMSVCVAMAGVSAMLFSISSSSVMAMQPEALETTIVVNTLEDELNSDGDCSLREAILAAWYSTSVDACPKGDDVITDTIIFDVAGTIILNEQLGVNPGGPLNINGGSAITVSGNDTVRVFYINTDAEVTLSNLTISDGYVDEGTVGGGGIYNHGGALTIISSTVSGNSVGSVGGGSGGGIYNQYGTLTIISSTLSGNSSPNAGGGIYYFGEKLSIINSTLSGNTGGGIVNSGAMTIISSTLSGNTSTGNGGGISHWYSDLTIINSTLSGNSAASDGGGIFNYGGTLTITNSTLSGNSSITSGGGIYNDSGAVTISSSTLSGNSAESGGGSVYNQSGPEGQVTAHGSIVANSPSGGNCAGDLITDGGYNLENADTCNFDPANGSLINTDPVLGQLQDNGGSTFTHALLEGSPAIDAGDPVICPPTDQRGMPKPLDGDLDGNPVCDIGSYEFGVVVPIEAVSLPGEATGTVGVSYTFTATVSPISTTLPVVYTWQASGQETVTHSGGLSDMLALTWDSPGTQAITVTATNFGGAVTDFHTIAISDVAISGLVASSNSPTLLGVHTTFTATVEEGTNVTYAWDFGDDTAGVGATLVHTYAATGVYTATVTASNSAGSMQICSVVTILDVPITGLVAISDSPTIMGVPTTFTATVEGGTNISYTWGFGDDTAGEGAVVTHTYDAVGVYTATVTAGNSTGSVQASTVVDVVIPETRVYLPLVKNELKKSTERAALMAFYTSTPWLK